MCILLSYENPTSEKHHAFFALCIKYDSYDSSFSTLVLSLCVCVKIIEGFKVSKACQSSHCSVYSKSYKDPCMG